MTSGIMICRCHSPGRLRRSVCHNLRWIRSKLDSPRRRVSTNLPLSTLRRKSAAVELGRNGAVESCHGGGLRKREDKHLKLSFLSGRFAMCRLSNEESLPSWATSGPFVSVTRTPDELSIVCPAGNVPDGVRCEKGWRCVRVCGTLDFGEIGILSSLLGPLAKARIPVFVISTYDTDHVLIKQEHETQARAVLVANGHEFED